MTHSLEMNPLKYMNLGIKSLMARVMKILKQENKGEYSFYKSNMP
jgi:hypothetical protein